MVYAEFYQMSLNWDGQHPSRPIPACGDRSVLILDGRCRADTWHQWAHEWATRHGFVGYRIHRGRNVLHSRPITEYTTSETKGETHV